MSSPACPCGLGPAYADCCGRWQNADAPTAELLMRSRFTAFVRGDTAYLLRTWHPRTRPRSLDLTGGPRYTGLEILGQTGGTLFETTGTVHFRAYYVGGVLEENSEFAREDGRWFYLSELSLR
jgi:SEC-C motif domain protein